MQKILNPIQKLLTSLLRLILSPFKFLVNRFFSIKGTENLKAALETPEIQKRIMFTVFIILVFRVLASIPLPGIDVEVYREAVNANTGSPFSNLLTIATGGNIDAPSLVVIGLGSYINASIIIQLLTSIIPRLEELQKEGPNGRRILSQVTRILTLPLSLIQGFVIYTIIKQNTQIIPGTAFSVSDMVAGISTTEITIMVLAIAAGSLLLMWLSELITESGVGNGSSIIIMVGILSTLPGLFIADFSNIFSWFRDQISNGNLDAIYSNSMLFIYAFVIGLILLIMGIVFVTEATRKVTIQYARRVRGIDAAQSSFLPLKINQAGVMPIIFASSLLTFPTIIAQFVTNMSEPGTSLYNIGLKITQLTIFDYRSYQYIAFYFVMIFLFTYFYSFIVMKPEETAENLQKSGGFIPGIRPGKSTAKFISNVMVRLTFLGALFLGIIAILPNLVRLTDQGSTMLVLTGVGGTSLLIIIGVVLDTFRQLKSLTVTKSYEMYR